MIKTTLYLTEIQTRYIICYRSVRLWCRRSTATRAPLTTLPMSSLWRWTNWKGSSGWREQGRIFLDATLWLKWTTFGTVNLPIQAILLLWGYWWICAGYGVKATAAGGRRQTVCLLRGSLLSLAPISVLLSPLHLLFGHFASDGWSLTTFPSS